MLENADKIIMIKSYGGFKKGARAKVTKKNNFYNAHFGQTVKTETWIRNALRKNKAKIMVTIHA